MGKFIDLTGQRFSRLVVDFRESTSPHGEIKWSCTCDCGNTCITFGNNLRKGHSRSCGCLHVDVVSGHGYNGSRTHNSWEACINRCYRESCVSYQYYGGRGITVCDRWREPAPQGFLNFLEDMGERPEGKTLNRVNGATQYSKETCAWATYSHQSYDKAYLRSDNSSGITGVGWYSAGSKWYARISYNRKDIHLGYTKDFDQAVKWRRDAELKYYGFHLGQEDQ